MSDVMFGYKSDNIDEEDHVIHLVANMNMERRSHTAK